MRVNPKGNFVSFKRKNVYNDRGRKISTNLIKKNHSQKIQATIIDLLYIQKKRRWKFFLLCVDKATHMKLNEIMFLLSHGSVTA